MSQALCAAPVLDLAITYFTIAPMIGGIIAGWVYYHSLVGAGIGFVCGVMSQMIAVYIWQFAHELANMKHVRGPRIVKVLNKAVGRWRNHAALWVTTLAVPLFWAVRLGEIIIYPMLVRLVGLPKYKEAEWVNLSRHKFEGLVGHDLIWCLYCDWMTGLWSLGSEMLRNVESFWCPIRFHSEKKCANCAIDFPDIFDKWVPADKGMQEVADVLAAHYPPGGWKKPPYSSWFSHPARLTIEGEPAPETTPSDDAPET